MSKDTRKWQPIDTAPKDGTVILVRCVDFTYLASWDSFDGWSVFPQPAQISSPTHWTSIPPFDGEGDQQ